MDDYALNIGNIAKSFDRYPTYLQKIVTKKLRTHYFTLADMMSEFDDRDIQEYARDLEHILSVPSAVNELPVLGVVMCIDAEGGVINDETAEKGIRSMLITLLVEDLGRKGVIEVQRENMSLLEDASDLPLAKRID